MIPIAVETKVSRLESIVEQIGDAVLSTTETIERLAQRVDSLTVQLEIQGKQVEQQSYQIFALCDAVQTLVDSHRESTREITRLSQTLDGMVSLIQNLDE
ncbi:MAG: hypothetical protein ACKPE1_11325 [Dolichospermum sp.]